MGIAQRLCVVHHRRRCRDRQYLTILLCRGGKWRRCLSADLHGLRCSCRPSAPYRRTILGPPCVRRRGERVQKCRWPWVLALLRSDLLIRRYVGSQLLRCYRRLGFEVFRRCRNRYPLGNCRDRIRCLLPIIHRRLWRADHLARRHADGRCAGRDRRY